MLSMASRDLRIVADPEVDERPVVVVALQAATIEVVPFLAGVEHVLKVPVHLELRGEDVTQVQVGRGALVFVAQTRPVRGVPDEVLARVVDEQPRTKSSPRETEARVRRGRHKIGHQAGGAGAGGAVVAFGRESRVVREEAQAPKCAGQKGQLLLVTQFDALNSGANQPPPAGCSRLNTAPSAQPITAASFIAAKAASS